jgi:hypothetical protein
MVHYCSPEHLSDHWSEIIVSITSVSFSNRKETHLKVQQNLRLFWIQRKHQKIEKREPESVWQNPKDVRSGERGVSDYRELNNMYISIYLSLIYLLYY